MSVEKVITHAGVLQEHWEVEEEGTKNWEYIAKGEKTVEEVWMQQDLLFFFLGLDL